MSASLVPTSSPETTYTPWPRCDAIIPLGATGEDSQLCGAQASHFCEFCGPRCSSCFNEFPCCENGGLHSEASEPYYRPTQHRLDLGLAMCLVIDGLTDGAL
jgi:hypothetical protein